ncbi:MAG TPA: cytochrome ubiquinol oxidase subunit I [Burkholderiales bacterium]|nr:cytochrome ubiquinol oxidase subunit I [Burkholderiales bacterium]
MESLDGLLLARIQFAANITFHILFPTITIALGWCLLFFRWRWLKTEHTAWLHAYRFWTKVFALSFALGVVSGVVMSFQFGTNWPGFMEKVGNIAGPLLGYEVLTAFFLEAAFLGIMLFGHGRVSERVHLLSTFLVASGTTLSAFWILALNSWMQTPAGFEVIDGKYHVTSWLEVIFNPSFPYRLTHMLLASSLTGCFLLAGISGWQLVRSVRNEATTKVLRFALTVAAVLIPIQIFVGDLHGLNTLKHQPAKIAAIEGIWETEKGAPLTLFGFPDEQQKKTHYAVEVPKAASLILTHEADGELKGLNEFPGTHPPVAPLFWSFRIMVGTGMAMLAVSWLGACLVWRRDPTPRWFNWTLVVMTFSGWVATVAGWYTTEIGRQPYIVYGLIATKDVASNTPPAHIAITLAAYLTLYAVLIIAYVTVLLHMAEKPAEPLAAPLSIPEQTPVVAS